MSVGSELRSARETRHLTLNEIARSTKIKVDLLVDLENDDVSRWPKQRIYRHGHLRAYALAVGLDPVLVAEKFDDEFGEPAPVAFHGAPSTPTPAWFRSVGNTMLVAALVVLVGATIRMLPPLRDNDEASSPIRPRATNVKTSAIVQAVAAPGHSAVITSSVSASSTEEQALSTDIETDIEGEIRIVSVPSEAHVTVNGIGRGQTPLRVRYLPLGAYTIRVTRPGFKIRETYVTLKSDQPRRTVRVVLEDRPLARATTLTAKSDDR
jgi:cytoskeletal protein RodZ